MSQYSVKLAKAVKLELVAESQSFDLQSLSGLAKHDFVGLVVRAQDKRVTRNEWNSLVRAALNGK
jgi:hypothetical protein